MTQDKINNAIKMCAEIDRQLARNILHTNAIHNITELNAKLKSLLQSDKEGREVLADAHQDSKESESMEVTFIDSMKDEIYTYFACCPRKDCENGSIVINSNFCQKCGQKLIWPDNQKR